MERNKNLIITIIVLVFLLGTAIVIAQFFEDFENVRLRKSNKTIFTSSDLIISKLSYNTSEKEIKKKTMMILFYVKLKLLVENICFQEILE